MLLGALPPVANAKDDGYVLYSEDGVEMKKMKREFFTADVEKMGCDYWKEGSGDDLQNTGGKIEPYDPRIYEGYESADVDRIGVRNSWKPEEEAEWSKLGSDGKGIAYSSYASKSKKNFYIYDSSKAKKYRHYGDFWVCFKLRDGESDLGGGYFVCGDRALVRSLYMSDPSQLSSVINSVSSIDGFPAAILCNGANYVYSGNQSIAQVSNSINAHDDYRANKIISDGTAYGVGSHFYNKTSHTTIATYNRNYGYGIRGVKQQGNIYSATFNYKDSVLDPRSDVWAYYETPPITHTDTYTYKYDEEVKLLVDTYYFTDVDYDPPESVSKLHAMSKLYNNDHGLDTHYLYKLGVGDTVILPPSQIEPTFCHILPVANSLDPVRDTYEGTFKSINAPRGVLRSIPVVGVETYSNPIYSAVPDYYYGFSHPYFMSVEDYYSYVGYVFYWKSMANYPIRNNRKSANLISGSGSYYYINDMVSDFIHNNYIAISRKGIEIAICKHVELEHDIVVGQSYFMEQTNRNMTMTIGAENMMDVDDISDIEDYYTQTLYNTKYSDHYTGGTAHSKPSDWYFNIEKYGDNTLEIDKVRVDTTLMDYSYYPPSNCDYRWLGDYRQPSFKSKFAAADDYIFDTDHTLNVIRNIPNPETGAPYDEYSLRTLWKMDININGVTRYSLDTTFPNARPQVMKLNFNPNASTNYGFGNEFSIDTTNNKVSRLGVRVDSNKVRRAGAQTIREKCLIMRDNTGAYQSIRLTGSGSWANQGNTSAKFRPENIYYCTRAVEAGTTISNDVNAYVSPLYSSYKHIYYRDVNGWSTPYTYYSGKPLYLVGTIDSEGWFSVVSMMYDNRARRYGFMTQDLPTSADGLYYIYLGRFVYDGGTYSYFELEENHPIYYYKYGRINEYHYRPQDLNDFVIYETPQSTPVSAVTNRGEVDLRFSGYFNNTWDDTTGMLTIGYWKQALPNLPLTPLVINEETAATNIAPSSYVKACDVEELLIEDGVTAYYIDFNVIFRTTDGTPMTDGTFEAMLSWSANPNYGQDWVDGTMGEPLGYFKAKRVYAPNENEIVLKMKGYFKRSAFRGAQYPYIVVKHTCSTNMDVGYSITGYQTAYPASS